VHLKVRLKVDLAGLPPELEAGRRGYAIGPYGQWNRAFDRFTGVRSPGTTLDVLWTGLEILDEDYLRKVAERKRTRMAAGSALSEQDLDVAARLADELERSGRVDEAVVLLKLIAQAAPPAASPRRWRKICRRRISRRSSAAWPTSPLPE
jgi:hypothetical protein